MSEISVLPIQSFAEAFFAHFGAQVNAHTDELVVDLPPQLAAHFNKTRLYLVFPTVQGKPRQLSPHEDLLVYGSRTFDLMLTLLNGQGETARLAYPRQVSVMLKAALGPSLRQPQFRLVETLVERQQNWYQIFNFRITYRSDEKEEIFETVVLDAKGHPNPQVETLLQHLPPLSQPPEVPAAFEPQPEQATDVIRQRANRHTVELQQQIKARLEKVLLRLNGFYQRLMAEVDTGQPEQDEQVRIDLQHELNRKIADELARHQLHISITPISTAVALLPSIDYRLSVTIHADNLTDVEQFAAPYDGLPAIDTATLPWLRWANYRWQYVKRDDYALYIGHHWLRGLAILVLDYSGTLLQWEQLGWLGFNKTPPEVMGQSSQNSNRLQ